ncbi:sigma-70 family RNA polymerase sigma factor [Algisphaera agarilytica]|uniref:RNA polymerase sigma factor (Sigma-70 family) n=1 Tax=Algisphaera agarilytica TaxID=1385975 RepID=A0A7X0H4R2_9BACT|nr:sigma-70 family RNA polymerase sigma factor [Algisphaera agarilytica]MBB6429236.1 RNA polymerase sigma factor (sigma-70 family) [Algisphaera agarilytica]
MTMIDTPEIPDTPSSAAETEIKWPKALKRHERRELAPLLLDPIDFIDDERFYEPQAWRTILDPKEDIPRASVGWYTRLAHERANDPRLKNAKLPLLTAAQERVIFLRFNYARFRAEQVRESINPKRFGVTKARELLKWHRMAMQLREQIAEYNLALVLAMAKRLPPGSVDFPEMISEGNMALLRGIDKFNVSKGFKFSTYACRAILKAFSRLGMKTTRYRSLFPVGFEPDLERSNYSAEKAAFEEEGCVEQVSMIFHENRSNLTDLELDIINKRFAFDNPDGGKGMTLQEVGKLVGLTKERVRQIQIHALAKMRSTLETSYLNGPSLGQALEDSDVAVGA